MSIQELTETLSFSLTINIIIATSATLLIDMSFFKDKISEALGEIYGLTIILLGFCYVFLQINKKRIFKQTLQSIRKKLLTNICCSLGLLTIFMFANKLGAIVVLVGGATLMTANIILSAYLFGYSIIPLFPRIHNWFLKIGWFE